MPSDLIVSRFIRISELAKGAVAVHCKGEIVCAILVSTWDHLNVISFAIDKGKNLNDKKAQ